ncbi:hypothetical protein EJ05DRAFT_475354 [Pseudovirgaria hyperparasitica]|uniref:Uncharacterized protein n=1 Tax=Pseudovirgaria hyperparasitica TaxID=470096 RepID=A0A6A6WBB0_9PEZI|nr:uncharacterized protein EJ05DRAFT_475354 [Pseudovirgaria hyperparasitica]KAF2759126.1 hypothetical protein EJ05DRAFT_475354 [Pseudovirgaria hyperparasitica]
MATPANDLEHTEPGSQPSLQTPYITVNDPNAHATMARSTPKRHPVEMPNALDDSSYDLMSSSEISQASSDDGQTTSVTSADDQAADEVRSISSGDEEEDEDAVHEEEVVDGTMLAHRTPCESMVASEGIDSVLTTRALSEPSIPALSISETKVELGHENIDLLQTLLELDTTSMPEQLKGVGFPFVSLSVGQHLAKDHIRLHRPYRLLYIGDASLKQPVIEKVSAALAISNGFAFDIHDEEVTDIHYVAKGQASHTDLVIDDSKRALRIGVEQSGILSTGYPSTSEIVPDLAIFCHTNEEFLRDPDPIYSSRARVDFAYRALARQGIPCLHTTVAGPLDGFDRHHAVPKYFRFILEGRMGPDGDSAQVCEPYPVSIDYFLSMSNFILNKHLAFLFSLPKTYEKTLLGSFGAWKQKLPKTAREHWAQSTVSQRLQALGTIIMTLFVVVSPILMLLQPPIPYATEHYQQSSNLKSPVSVAVTTPTAIASATTAAVTGLAPTSKSLGKPLRDMTSATAGCNETVSVKLHDRRQLVFTTPGCWAELRRRPSINIKVSHGHWNVKVNVPRKHEGPYTLVLEDLAKADAVNVTVWTTSKPLINQTTEISLRRPWFGSRLFLQATRRAKSFGLNSTSASTIINEYKAVVDGWLDSASARARTEVMKKTTAFRQRIVSGIAVTTDARIGQARRNADRLIRNLKGLKDILINKTVEYTTSDPFEQEHTRRPDRKAQQAGKLWKKANRKEG